MLYTGCQSGRTAAIAHHVSFDQITCIKYLLKLMQCLNFVSYCLDSICPVLSKEVMINMM